MHEFLDSQGRWWKVSLSRDAVRRVHRHLDIDLIALAKDPTLKGVAGLVTDAPRLVNVLFALCMPEAEKLGVSDLDFGAAMQCSPGAERRFDPIVQGACALVAEIAETVANPRVRVALRNVVRIENSKG